MDQENFRKLISREPETLAQIAIRCGLRILSVLYSSAVSVRNFLYDRHILRIHQVDRPVISVGNITAGGTGKTPMVVWLCNVFNERKKKAGILTRGYKTDSDKINDEPALLEANCPNAKVIVNPDRIAGAAKAIEEFNCDVLIMDDGFQHRRLCRELDILMIDATVPFGYGKVLPAGFLRESLKGLSRAGAVVITRCDLVNTKVLENIERQLRRYSPGITIARSEHKAREAVLSESERISVDELNGLKVWAFSGIGNPGAFEKTLEQAGCELVGARAFPDHHQYNEYDINEIFAQARRCGARLILTTEKDWGKIKELIDDDLKAESQPLSKASNNRAKDSKIGYFAVKLQITTAREQLIKLIDEALAGKINVNVR